MDINHIIGQLKQLDLVTYPKEVNEKLLRQTGKWAVSW